MKGGIIGAGLMGKKRASAAKKNGVTIQYVTDIDTTAAQELAAQYGARVVSWEECLNDPSIDVVFICTSHNMLAEIATVAIEKGKHVLIEKPAGRTVAEIEKIVNAHTNILKKKFVCAKVGYNHRFHPMIAQLKKVCDEGILGDLLFMTGEYGHGGREGMQHEWRCDKKSAGGGELLDQGSHLIDLYQWMFDPVVKTQGMIPTYVWKSTNPTEDNGFILVQNSTGNIGHFHVSWTLWKNSFQLKVVGKQGMAVVSGLGKSYGTERLTVYKRGTEGKVFREETYTDDDHSFEDEVAYFVECIKNKKQPEGNITDAVHTMKSIQDAYRGSR